MLDQPDFRSVHKRQAAEANPRSPTPVGPTRGKANRPRLANQLVYELSGLTDDEIAIVEGRV